MMQRKTRKGWEKETGGKTGEGKKMKMNHLINGWECWLMVSKGTISSPIICQKNALAQWPKETKEKTPC